MTDALPLFVVCHRCVFLEVAGGPFALCGARSVWGAIGVPAVSENMKYENRVVEFDVMLQI